MYSIDINGPRAALSDPLTLWEVARQLFAQRSKRVRGISAGEVRGAVEMEPYAPVIPVIEILKARGRGGEVELVRELAEDMTRRYTRRAESLADELADMLLEAAPAPVKKGVDTDGDGREHPAKYFTGLDAETRAARERGIERRQDEGITGRALYEDLPGDEAPTRPSKYTRTALAEKVREEQKGPGKEAFLRAAAEVGGVRRAILRRVYDRGLKAWATSGHRPGATAEQWAIARVYSFLTGGKTRTTADADLAREADADAISKAGLPPGLTRPPEAVARAARRGLELRRKYKRGGLSTQEAGEQGIGSGVQRAVNLSHRDELTLETLKMMRGFFSRHAKNARGTHPDGGPSAGAIAWLLWGGDPGRAWVERTLDTIERMSAEGER